MANKYKNEKDIMLGGEKITLRPDFENLQNLESSKFGGLPNVANRILQDGKNKLIGLCDCVEVIFHCHTPKKYKSQEEIWEIMNGTPECITIQAEMYHFFNSIMNGNKAKVELSEEQKKS